MGGKDMWMLECKTAILKEYKKSFVHTEEHFASYIFLQIRCICPWETK